MPLPADDIVTNDLREDIRVGDLLYPAEVRRASNGVGAGVLVTVPDVVAVSGEGNGRRAAENLFRFRIGGHRHAESRGEAKADEGDGAARCIRSHKPFLSQTRWTERLCGVSRYAKAELSVSGHPVRSATYPMPRSGMR
ncbi:hypothetical protein GCM10010151_47300 [Actinoallomurus spadix]|uniref:Uncharacterized protein n=1 Tax=Actinoallomurus spadix TaxID=79912 RepID=A0ABN0X0V4_9ACTN